MKIISLVPSLTETFIHAGAHVVGRTRFCIHPQEQIRSIPAIGGTKDIDWQKALTLGADLVIMDKEENTLEMAKTCPLEYFATHIQSINDLPQTLETLSKKLKNASLLDHSQRWSNLLHSPPHTTDLKKLPGVLEWLSPIEEKIEKVIYIIWKDPWMAASHQTFIGSIFHHLGHEETFLQSDQPYPSINLENLASPNTLLLFSSEPYPFHKQTRQLLQLPGPKAIVDGECFSWFGLRTLEFLELHHQK